MSTIISILSFILSIIAIILIIVLFILIIFRADLWNYTIGNISSGMDTFYPSYRSIYKPNINGALMLTIQYNKNGYVGETFMIDNTQNPNNIIVRGSSNFTITDNIGQGNIEARTSALYIWETNTNINRLR